MLPAYKGLQDAAAEQITDEKRIKELFESWSKLNAIRGIMIGTGAILGIWASLR
jgi:hypothetical protein